MRLMSMLMFVSVFTIGSLLAGCAGRTELLPNKDPALRKTPAEFAADAAKRHPYPADAPRGGTAMGRVEVDYVLDELKLVNTSDAPWTDVEVWVNAEYVVFLPQVESRVLKKPNFRMLYNGQGQYFPTSNGEFFNRKPILVQKVELFRDGKLYDVPISKME